MTEELLPLPPPTPRNYHGGKGTSKARREASSFFFCKPSIFSPISELYAAAHHVVTEFQNALFETHGRTRSFFCVLGVVALLRMTHQSECELKRMKPGWIRIPILFCVIFWRRRYLKTKWKCSHPYHCLAISRSRLLG